jgi:hypothetical protein
LCSCSSCATTGSKRTRARVHTSIPYLVLYRAPRQRAAPASCAAARATERVRLVVHRPARPRRPSACTRPQARAPGRRSAAPAGPPPARSRRRHSRPARASTMVLGGGTGAASVRDAPRCGGSVCALGAPVSGSGSDAVAAISWRRQARVPDPTATVGSVGPGCGGDSMTSTSRADASVVPRTIAHATGAGPGPAQSCSTTSASWPAAARNCAGMVRA